MASFFMPAFPSYDGPHQVGSIDVEMASSQLEDGTSTVSPAPTVAFRVFYPCIDTPKPAAPVYWVQKPQRSTVSAYVKFLGVKSALADLLSYFPQLLYHVRLPVHRNAPLLQPATASGQWPVMVFSHGLGGSRNAYSHMCGSLASHGIIVLAPEHRDGSCPISYVRATSDTKATTVGYNRHSHTPSPEVYAGRDDQLRVRLWELGLIHEALRKLQSGEPVANLDSKVDSKDNTSPADVLTDFKGKLAVEEPGSIIWAGHSFGANTTVQFVKSIYYHPSNPHFSKSHPQETLEPSSILAYTPSTSLLNQITHSSPTALLDLWCLPLNSPSTASLKTRPMPFYSRPASSAPNNTAPIIAILSSAFVKWSSNFNDVRSALAPPHTPEANKHPAAQIFYPTSSAHLSQSDFGILFPRLTRYLAKAAAPDRVLQLNVRAILQVLRNAGVQVAGAHDPAILSTSAGEVAGWVAVGGDNDSDADSLDSQSVFDEKQGLGSDLLDESAVLGNAELEGVKAS